MGDFLCGEYPNVMRVLHAPLMVMTPLKGSISTLSARLLRPLLVFGARSVDCKELTKVMVEAIGHIIIAPIPGLNVTHVLPGSRTRGAGCSLIY